MRFYFLFTAAALLMILKSCKSKEEQLKSGWWKYENGFHLNDQLFFSDSNLRNDTIFIDQKAIAKIISLNNHEIEIIAISTGEKGIYTHK